MNNQRTIYLILGLGLGVLFYMTMAPSTDPTIALILSLAVGIIFVSVGINLNEEPEQGGAPADIEQDGEVNLGDSDSRETDHPEETKP